MFTRENADQVYDILVTMGGASKNLRNLFVHKHVYSDVMSEEWRFEGVFGFGGKYRSKTNSIDYYRENQRTDLDELMNNINEELKKVF